MNTETVVQTQTLDQIRDQIRTALTNGIVHVEFTSKDGTNKTMYCTLNEALIPAASRSKDAAAGTHQDPDLFKVYATDRQGWRSFRLERVSRICEERAIEIAHCK